MLRTIIVAVLANLVFAALGAVGFFWWPAWAIAAGLYALILVGFWVTRPTRPSGY